MAGSPHSGYGAYGVYGGMPQIEQDRAAAREWARALLNGGGWVIVDTETTGLDATSEIVEVAALGPGGEVLLDTLVRPVGRIPAVVTAIHGIGEAHTAAAPSYADLHPLLRQLLAGKTVVSYNAAYDKRLLSQTAALHGLRPPRARWECAMVQYARYVGDWDARKGDYRWHRLPCIDGAAAHSALGDCRATLALLERMAAG